MSRKYKWTGAMIGGIIGLVMAMILSRIYINLHIINFLNFSAIGGIIGIVVFKVTVLDPIDDSGVFGPNCFFWICAIFVSVLGGATGQNIVIYLIIGVVYGLLVIFVISLFSGFPPGEYDSSANIWSYARFGAIISSPVIFYSHLIFPILIQLVLVFAFIGCKLGKPFDRKFEQKKAQHQQYLQTVPGIFDTAKSLSSEANKLFQLKSYADALNAYENTLANFTRASVGAIALKDTELVKTISNNIISIKKNTTVCKNILGSEIASKARRKFEKYDFRDAIQTYEESLKYFQDTELITKTKTNIENCYIEIDTRKVEELSAQAISLLKEAAALNEPFKARDIFNEADKLIEDAISFARKRNFRDSIKQLIVISKDIQNQRDIIYDQLSNEEIITGKYDVDTIEGNVPSIANDVSLPNNRINVFREHEFYNGFIRFKMSVTNTTDFVVHDVALDFDFDDVLLQINKHEPEYPTKNGKIFLGNISGNSSKSIAVYLDPMMCSKGTDINCQINYKDAKGQAQSTRMEPKKISVVCPIMKTDSDINIGRLKEFVENLPHRDSKVYQLQAGFDIEQLHNITHEVVQKHDVKHIRTLHTKDGGTCEIWYYGKTKVNSHNIVIRITISGDTQSIELFAATPTPESLAGLLAEVGREIKSAIDAKTVGDNVKQVLNVTIKDSIIQRSNLLSFCDINGNCTGDVVIEDSVVQRSGIWLDAQIKDSVMAQNNVCTNSCPACEMELPDGAKFCLECGENLIK